MLSKNQFCLLHNMELQCFNSLFNMGMINANKNASGRFMVSESEMDRLREGVHYVCCPVCGKKMCSVTKKHYKLCTKSEKYPDPIYSELCLKNKTKTEEQKEFQSNKLKKRFKTKKGEKTRRHTAEASRALNSDAEFRMRMKEYVDKNIEVLKESALNARKHLKKTSKLHIKYKENMIKNGLSGFESELEVGHYSVDEGDSIAKLAVEIDVCYWHGCSKCGFKGDDRIKRIDSRKEGYLTKHGWYIIRVPEHEIKNDSNAYIEMIRTVQKRRRQINKEKIKESFYLNKLSVKSMVNENEVKWVSLKDVVRHHTPHKNIFKIDTDKGSVSVTEDHSVFRWEDKRPVLSKTLKIGDEIVSSKSLKIDKAVVKGVTKLDPENETYDVSVPGTECAFLESGILVHNTYSVSGVSLDIEKSSKYQSMKENFIGEYDKLKEEAKSSIKIIKGLKQPRYGIGISSALGPYSRPGVQSRRNYISGFRGGWS